MAEVLRTRGGDEIATLRARFSQFTEFPFTDDPSGRLDWLKLMERSSKLAEHRSFIVFSCIQVPGEAIPAASFSMAWDTPWA